MKSSIFLFVLLMFVALFGCQTDGEGTVNETETDSTFVPRITFTSDIQKISYCIGLDHGSTGRLYYSSGPLEGKFNINEMEKGMVDYLTGTPLRIQVSAVDSIFNLYLMDDGNVDSSIVSCADGSYAMGMNEGRSLVGALVSKGIDQTVVVDLMVEGIKDGMEQKTPSVPLKEARIEVVAYYADINRQLGENFLMNNAQRTEIKTTDSGLQYEVFEVGSGQQAYFLDTLTIHYTARFVDGRVFETTIPSKIPLKVVPANAFPGLTEGLTMMKKGAQFRFYMPHELAYGEQGSDRVEPYSALIYDIELIDIKPYQ